MTTIQERAGAYTLASASSEAALTATNSGEDETPLMLVERFLNEFGQALPSEMLRQLLIGRQQGKGQQTPSFLGLQLWFVLDSSSLQIALRSWMRRGEADLFEGMKAGFVRVTAPPLLDDEIRKHAPRIARSCKVTVQHVLDRYSEIRPLIEFREVSTEVVRRLRQEIPDPDDADFVAHFLDVPSLGIITEDKGFQAVPKLRTFAITEVRTIHLAYRKQAVALVCVGPAAALVAAASRPIIAAAAALCAGAKRNPGMLVGIAALLAALGIMFPEERKQLVSRLREAASNLSARWSVAEPWVFACLQALSSRAQEAALVSQVLGVPSSTARAQGVASGTVEVAG